MPATILERFDSREATAGGDSPSVDLVFVVQGTEDDIEAKLLVEATLPAIYAGLVFQSYRIAHLGGGVWEATARYGKDEEDEPGQSSYSFETGGGTQHITQSLSTVGSYASGGGQAPNFGGAIGVTADSVEGVDVTVPVYNFAETHHVPAGMVTGGYKATLFWLTGKVNSGPFKGFARGEVLFLGASGSKRGSDAWEISFKFAASPNASGLQVGDISGISKRGWEYLWVRYVDAEDAQALIKRPQAAYVEQVYQYGDLSSLGIGG